MLKMPSVPMPAVAEPAVPKPYRQPAFPPERIRPRRPPREGSPRGPPAPPRGAPHPRPPPLQLPPPRRGVGDEPLDLVTGRVQGAPERRARMAIGVGEQLDRA